MTKKSWHLFVILVVVFLLSLSLVACGDSETTTTTAATTQAPSTTVPEVTTAKPITTTKTPDSTAAPNIETTKAPVITTEAPVTYNGPNEQWIEEVLFETGMWVQPHAKYTLGTAKGKDGVKYDYMWYFTIVAEGKHFDATPENHPTNPKTHGIQMVKDPIGLYIKDMNDPNADYTKYEISYWQTASWYEIWCVADGFVPVDGTAYDIYLVFKTPADLVLEDGTVISNGATYPDTLHYIWDFGEPWVYEAPAKAESKYLSQDELKDIIGDSFFLRENEPTTIKEDGSVQVKFVSDGNPFINNIDYGVAYTLFGELYINGEEYDIVADSYQTEQWYILNFKVKDFTPVVGEKYEILFTITSTDSSKIHCQYDSYYVFTTVTFAG